MNIAVIGCGNMGSALVRGLGQQPGHHLVVSDLDEAKVQKAAEGAVSEVVYAPGVAQAAHSAEVVLLVVKPKHIPAALAEAAEHAPDDALFISCAAGVEMATLEEAAPGKRVARCMPNTGAGLGQSTTALLLGGASVAAEDLHKARDVLGAVGEVHVLPDEDSFHVQTALCGSGPAYFLLAAEAMVDEGVRLGMSRSDAAAHVRGALRAASALLDDDAQGAGVGAATLRSHITSPGGTTIAGLMAMEESGGRACFHAAVDAAEQRSRQMAAGQGPSGFEG